MRTHNYQGCFAVIDKFRDLLEDGTPGNMGLNLYAEVALNLCPLFSMAACLAFIPPSVVIFLNNMQQADFIPRLARYLDCVLQCMFSHRREIPWNHNDLAVDFHNVNVFS
jgi:hypothetical protein